MNKKFILGVGAQKSGTSWLYRYLKCCPYFNMGIMKEYHIWDALSITDCEKYLLKSWIDIFKKKGVLYPSPINIIRNVIRYQMQSKKGFYEKFFLYFIKGNAGATGDITPEYSGLSIDMFKDIKKRIEGFGFDIKVIFLMRDPFERCWSAVRMYKRKQRLKGNDSDILKKLYKTSDFIFHTNYKKTIETLESVFEKKNIFYGIYEEMFKEENINQLSSFLDTDSNPTFGDIKIESYPKLNYIDKDLKYEIIRFYEDIYEYCFKKFPQTKYLWSKNI
jgi:hypothetical protein